jgi:preprotein translocase subunit SecA
MEHMREGIHWTSVGQRDPLVEYRRRAQGMFEAMQITLRREVLRLLFHAVPAHSHTHDMHETALTRAARNSVDNADVITAGVSGHDEEFKVKKPAKKTASGKKKKQVRKSERQNRKKSRK